MAANFAVIVVFAALSLLSLRSRGAHASAGVATECPDNKDNVVPLQVTAPGTTLKVKCASGATMTPTIGGNTVKKVFCDQACENEKELSALCPGATGTEQSKEVTLSFPQLANAATTVYLKCHGTNTCIFAVTLNEAPLQGPQACAVKGTTVQLALQGASGATTFGCGPTLKLKPTDPKKAYNDDCKTEHNLKDLTLTSLDNTYYKLGATKAPPTKTLCYLCGDSGEKGTRKEDHCTVLISVSGGTRVGALLAFGLALPCVVTLLHFT